MNSPTTFYVVRHGQTDWNIQKKVQGHANIPLNKTGESQAEELAHELQKVEFDEVFSSDLLRAKRTAEIIALEKKLAVKTTEVLRERSYGSLEGMNASEFFSLYKDWDVLTDKERWNKQIADEETPEQAITRFLTFIRETAVAYEGKTLLLVAHGGLLRALLLKLGYGTWDTIGGIQNCGYVKLTSDGVEFVIQEVKGVKTWKQHVQK